MSRGRGAGLGQAPPRRLSRRLISGRVVARTGQTVPHSAPGRRSATRSQWAVRRQTRPTRGPLDLVNIPAPASRAKNWAAAGRRLASWIPASKAQVPRPGALPPVAPAARLVPIDQTAMLSKVWQAAWQHRVAHGLGAEPGLQKWSAV